jgi:hypothetical protein
MATAIHERRLGEPADAFIEVTSVGYPSVDVRFHQHC